MSCLASIPTSKGKLNKTIITLFGSIRMSCGTDNIPRNVGNIQECSMEYG